MPHATATREIIALPYVDIQHDALAVFDDVEQGVVRSEDIWISGYRAGSPSVHGKAKVEASDEAGSSSLTCRGGVDVQRISKTSFTVSIPSLQLADVPVRFARSVIHPPYTRDKSTTPPLSINSLAYSAKRQRLAVAGPDGYLCLVSSSSGGSSSSESAPPGSTQGDQDGGGAVRFRGHVGDVLDVKFFPSGEVALSTSSDLSLRIWGMDGSNPRTLKGHVRAVTCSAIFGVGKQVLSGSKDGTVRLWSVAEGREVRRWTADRPRSAIEAIFLDTPSTSASGSASVSDSESTGSSDREGRVLVARQDGIIQLFDLASDSAEEVGRIDSGVQSQLVSAAWDPASRLLAVGHANGTVHIRVLPPLERSATGAAASSTDAGPNADLSRAIAVDREIMFKRNEASIYSLAWTAGGDLLVGTAAGLPCRLGVSLVDRIGEAINEAPQTDRQDAQASGIEIVVQEEFAGWEAVGVAAWAVDEAGGNVWCAGAEGGVRRY